jgi:hypothetical protein
MDVRAGVKEYWKRLRLNPAQMEARLENQWKGQRAAKKEAYAADAPARAARAALAAEEQARRAALPRTQHGVEVVPPEPGAQRRFAGVCWDSRNGLWMARYKTAEQTRGSRNRRTLGRYATEQIAARARHKRICDEGFEQFNTMDVLDDATDLMVPREKKPPKKRPPKKRPPKKRPLEPVAAAPTRQSSRVRKAVSKD